MKKKASELKVGDEIKVAGKFFRIGSIEFSEMGKQGTKKCRLEAKAEEGDDIILIRPQDYPFDVKE